MPKVLLVDDEDKFREALAKRLNLRGYDTVDADNGDAAFKIIRNDRDIDVVLLDRTMPGMSGEQTLKAIKEIRPEVQVVRPLRPWQEAPRRRTPYDRAVATVPAEPTAPDARTAARSAADVHDLVAEVLQERSDPTDAQASKGSGVVELARYLRRQVAR